MSNSANPELEMATVDTAPGSHASGMGGGGSGGGGKKPNPNLKSSHDEPDYDWLMDQGR